MNRMAVVIVVVLLAVMMLGRTYLIADICPPTPITNVPGYADPNLINHKLLCAFEFVEGDLFSKSVSACDPEDQTLIFSLSNEPNGMIITAVDPNEAKIEWLAVKGIYYVDVEVIDLPPAGQIPGADNGSIVLKVHKKNEPPVFWGCR